MMMSPETFIEFNLKGKTKEQADKEVKDLHSTIRRLKKTVEKNDPKDFMIFPSPAGRFAMSMDYLAEARKFYEKQGWEYVPSEEEIKIDKFNERIALVSEIEYGYTVFMHGTETRTISFDGEKILPSRNFEGAFIHDHKEGWEGWYDDMTRSDIIDTILEYQMYDWPHKYEDANVLDGYCWSLKFRLSDGSKSLVFDGMNEFPDMMMDLLDAIGMRDIT